LRHASYKFSNPERRGFYRATQSVLILLCTVGLSAWG
jgi:hypothetical protein